MDTPCPNYSVEKIPYDKARSILMLTSPKHLCDLAMKYGTPLYILDVKKVLNNLATLRDGIALNYPNSEITYSVKTNYLSHILQRILDQGGRLEVVSRHEMTLAEQNGASANDILFNGPGKRDDDLSYCYVHSIDINLDSVEELEAAMSIGTVSRPFRVGLRVAAHLANDRLSRFGINFEDSAVVQRIQTQLDSKRVEIVGLHIHHSSRRDTQSYCDRIETLSEVADLLGITPSYLDIGGGIGSIPPKEIAEKLHYPLDDPKQLALAIGKYARSKWGINGPRLIMEPGIGILAECMNYITRIVSVKSQSENITAVCDGSMFDVNPLRSSIHPPCHLLNDAQSASRSHSVPIPLYGSTCMEIDKIGILQANDSPKAGDLVVVTNVGAYTTCLSPQFIIPSAPVYSLDEDKLVRDRSPLGFFGGAGR